MAAEDRLDDFRERFPEFAASGDHAATDEAATNALEFAETIYDRLDLGVLYLAAHALALTQAEGVGTEAVDDGAGIITREDFTLASHEYLVQGMTNLEIWCQRSQYGRSFWALRTGLPSIAAAVY